MYGIEHENFVSHGGELRLAVPAVCAERARDLKTDVALVPVAEVPSILAATGGCVITDYCISAVGAVDTVALLSNSPLSDIHTVYLDSHSRTSVQLVRILAREMWGNYSSITWLDSCDLFSHAHVAAGSVPGSRSVLSDELIKPGVGVLAIGDKVFQIQEAFSYKWDLAEQWQQHTGLPFVFAVWVAVTPAGMQFEPLLNDMLRFGVGDVAAAVDSCRSSASSNAASAVAAVGRERACHYLTENIKFELTDAGRMAMRLFWEKIITPG